MAQEDGPFHMTRRYADFNNSLLLFLPKKPVGKGDMASVYSPEGVRPLNVTNTDNRLVASSVRAAVEPTLGQLVTMDRRGLISGRSMLANILDVEEAMAMATFRGIRSLAVFRLFRSLSIDRTRSHV